MVNIGIAGAGLVGRLLAWRLLGEGHNVTLFDQDDGDGQQSAGFIAAAMLAPYSEVVTAEPAVFNWGVSALKLWPQWLDELREQTGINVDYQQRGSLVVSHKADRPDLEWFYQKLQGLEVIPDDKYHWLSPTQLSSLEGELAGFEDAVYLPEEACLDNRTVYLALKQAIINAGGNWKQGHSVTSVKPGSIYASVQSIGDSCHHFEQVIDCRGFGAKQQVSGLRGVRGEILWVKAPEVKFSRPVRLMHPRYQLYIVPKPDDIYVIGATEIESESLMPVTVRSSLELLSALYSVHSGFAEGQVLESRSHCRPAFTDNLPRIDRSSGLLSVNGLYRHGYLLGPSLVNRAVDVLSGRYDKNESVLSTSKKDFSEAHVQKIAVVETAMDEMTVVEEVL